MRTRTALLLPLLGLACILVAGCSGSTTGESPNVTSLLPPIRINGLLTYERPAETNAAGLNYGALTTSPVRNAVVDILNQGGETIASTLTAANGRYEVYVPRNPFRIRVRARTAGGVVVVDNTSGGAEYTFLSELGSPSTEGTTFVWNKNFTVGFNAAGAQIGPRESAPFAILDTAYTAQSAFEAVRGGNGTYPELPIQWSVNNSNGAFYSVDDGYLYLSGLADVDTDEFDQHVIAHEWGHYFQHRIARWDSLGGPHFFGQILNLRTAFSEGFANALSSMVLFPDSVYKDSSGPNQGTSWSADIETNNLYFPNTGWFTETTVAEVLYDLFDPANEAWDTLALGLGPVFDMMAAQADIEPFTSIFSALAFFQTTYPAQQGAINTLLGVSNITAPVADAYGTGEIIGPAGSIPVYNTLLADGPAVATTLTNTGAFGSTDLENNRIFRFSGDGTTMKVRTVSDAGAAVGIEVYHRGELVALGGLDAPVPVPTTAGETYVLRVFSAAATVGAINTAVSLSH